MGSESEEDEQPRQSEAERYRKLLTGASGGAGRGAGKEWGADAEEDALEVLLPPS